MAWPPCSYCWPQIDTEGYDATVISGALGSIAEGRIGILTFEYHRFGVWKEYTLEGVVDKLDNHGYVC